MVKTMTALEIFNLWYGENHSAIQEDLKNVPEQELNTFVATLPKMHTIFRQWACFTQYSKWYWKYTYKG